MNIDSLKELGWREIMQISKPKKELFKPGIYFLIRKDEIVYVGRSSSIARRILQHHAKRRIEFDRYAYLIWKPEEIAELERHFIWKFVPRCNTAMLQVSQEALEEIRAGVKYR